MITEMLKDTSKPKDFPLKVPPKIQVAIKDA
jgi:hypothetical protein